MAREAVKALKRERKELVRSLRTVDSVLAKLGATVKKRRTAKRKASKPRKAKAKTETTRPEPKPKAARKK